MTRQKARSPTKRPLKPPALPRLFVTNEHIHLTGSFSRDMICKVLFSASHLVLATWAGYGLILIAMNKSRQGHISYRDVNHAFCPPI